MSNDAAIQKFYKTQDVKMCMESLEFDGYVVAKRALRVITANLDDITPTALRSPRQAKSLLDEVRKSIENAVKDCPYSPGETVATRIIASNLETMAAAYEQNRQHEVAEHLKSLAQQLYTVARPGKMRV